MTVPPPNYQAQAPLPWEPAKPWQAQGSSPWAAAEVHTPAMPGWNAHTGAPQGGYSVGSSSVPTHGIAGGGPWASSESHAESIYNGAVGYGPPAAAPPWAQQGYGQPLQHGQFQAPQMQHHYDMRTPQGVYSAAAPWGAHDVGTPQAAYSAGPPQASGHAWGQGNHSHQTDGQMAMPSSGVLPNAADPDTAKEMKRRKQQEMQRALQAQMEENAQRKEDRKRLEKLREEKEEERIRREGGTDALPGPAAAKNHAASPSSENATHGMAYGASHAPQEQAKHGRRQFADPDAQQGRPPRPPAYVAEDEDPKVAQRRRKQEQMEAMQRDLQQQIEEKKIQKEREQRALKEEEERQEERIRRDMEILAQREAAEKQEKQRKEMELQQVQHTPAMGKTRDRLRDTKMGKSRERLRDPEMGKTRDRLRERDPEMGKTRDSLRQTGMGETRDRLRESDMGRSRKGRRPRTRGGDAAFSEPPARRTRQADPTSPKRPFMMESPDAFRGGGLGLQDGNDLSMGMRAFNERQQAFVQEMHQQVESLRRQRDEVAQLAVRHRETELDRRVQELDLLQQQLVQQLHHGKDARGSSSSSNNGGEQQYGAGYRRGEQHHGASRRGGSQPPPMLSDYGLNDSSPWEKSLAGDTRFVPAHEPPTWLDTQGGQLGLNENLNVAESLVHKALTGDHHFSAMGTKGATARNSQSFGPPFLLSGSSHLVPGTDLHQAMADANVGSVHVGNLQLGGSCSSGTGKERAGSGSLERAEQSDSWNITGIKPAAEQSADDSWKLLEEPLRKLEDSENVIENNEMTEVQDSDSKGPVLPEQQVETFKSALQMADGLPLELRDDLCKLLEEMPLGTGAKTGISELPSLSISRNSTASEETSKRSERSRMRSEDVGKQVPRPPRSAGSRNHSPRSQISAEHPQFSGRARSRSNCLEESEAALLRDELSRADRASGSFPARQRRISEERRAQSAAAAQVRKAEDEMIHSMKSVPSPRSHPKSEDDALSQLLSSHSRPCSAPE